MQTAMGRPIGAKMMILGVPGGSLEGPPLSLVGLLEALGVHVGAKLVILGILGEQVGYFGSPRGLWRDLR